MTSPTSQENEINFEKSLHRLEEILEAMNKETLSLEESLKLYEEADKLMTFCQKKLTESEERVEMLIKNRQGDLIQNDQGTPLTEAFPF